MASLIFCKGEMWLLLHVDQIAVLLGCLIPSLGIAYTDARSYLIPDRLTLPIFLAGLVAAVYRGNLTDAFWGAAISFGIMFILAIMGGAGGGDVKYAAGLGMWFGINGALFILLVSSTFGVLWGIVKMLRKGELIARLEAFFRGVYLRVVCNVKGTVILPKLPEDPSAPVPSGVVPFGTCLTFSAWVLWVISIKGV